MKKVERTHYPVVGSSALKPEYTEHIVDFPLSPEKRGKHVLAGNTFSRSGRRIVAHIMHTQSVQELLYGTLQGKSFNKAKGWQSLAMGSTLFVIAIACLFVGR